MARGIANKFTGKTGKGQQYFNQLMQTAGVQANSPAGQQISKFVKSLDDPSNSEYYTWDWVNRFMKQNNINDRNIQQAFGKVLKAHEQIDQKFSTANRQSQAMDRQNQAYTAQGQQPAQPQRQAQPKQQPAGMGGGQAQDTQQQNVLGKQKVQPAQQQQNIPQFKKVQR